MATLNDVKSSLTQRLEQSISVIVGRRGADGEIEAAKLALAEDAAEAFRDLGRDCVAELESRTPISYTADAELDRNQAFLIDDADDLSELSGFSSLADLAATLPVTPPRDLDIGIQFYALVVGDNARVVLVRRTDPKIAYRSGRWLAIAGETLTKLDEPAFSFSPGFDFLIGPAWALILNQTTFERLFREIGLIEKHVRSWVTGITDFLPMEADSEVELIRVAHEDSRTWRRLREIRRRGHLSGVALAEVRLYARLVGLDPETIVRNEKLVFDPALRFSFLHLLNEDLYRGPLTDVTFEAQRKAATEGA